MADRADLLAIRRQLRGITVALEGMAERHDPKAPGRRPDLLLAAARQTEGARKTLNGATATAGLEAERRHRWRGWPRRISASLWNRLGRARRPRDL